MQSVNYFPRKRVFSSCVERVGGALIESEKMTKSRPGTCTIMVTAREMAYISAEKMDAMRGSEAQNPLGAYSLLGHVSILYDL